MTRPSRPRAGAGDRQGGGHRRGALRLRCGGQRHLGRPGAGDLDAGLHPEQRTGHQRGDHRPAARLPDLLSRLGRRRLRRRHRTITWELGTLSASGSVTLRDDRGSGCPGGRAHRQRGHHRLRRDGTRRWSGLDHRHVRERAGRHRDAGADRCPTPPWSSGPDGQPVSIPIEFLVFFFIGSLGVLAFANVRAVRRRR